MATVETKWLIDTSVLVDLLRGSKLAREWIDTLPETARLPFPNLRMEKPYSPA